MQEGQKQRWTEGSKEERKKKRKNDPKVEGRNKRKKEGVKETNHNPSETCFVYLGFWRLFTVSIEDG